MANEGHLTVLGQGVSTWNEWREKNPKIFPDLSGANLAEADLYQADFSRADLRKATLPRAQLQKANFTEANLQGATLTAAQLQGATLHAANLRGVSLREANLHGALLLRALLQEADLQDADLTEAIDLQVGQLARANLAGVKLPASLDKFDRLATVKELSESAQKLQLSMLLGCVYSWLTIATTTDARLLPNSTSSPLPIIQTEIPIAGFYWVAPLLLVGVYIYFHLYLQRLWEALAALPAILPDGRSLDQQASSWLLNGLVYIHFKRLKNSRPALFRLQREISLLLAWWVVPITLFCFWLRYLQRHDGLGTAFHIVLLVTSIAVGILFQRLTTATLQGRKRSPYLWRKAWQDGRTYSRSAAALGAGGICLILYVLCLGPIAGTPARLRSWSCDGYALASKGSSLVRYWPIKGVADNGPDDGSDQACVPDAFGLFAFLGYRPFANLTEADVSKKPSNWAGSKEKGKDEVALTKGAPLSAANLRHASMARAFLVKADLRHADLQRANLRYADLREANLSGADLRGATLLHVQLQGAILHGTQLQGAHLGGADLRGATLLHVQLQGATLSADTQDILNAEIPEANPSEATILGDIFGSDEISFIVSADLRGANLLHADLQGADLSGARLQEAKDLTIVQLARVKSLYNAELDEPLMRQVQKKQRPQNSPTSLWHDKISSFPSLAPER